MCSRPAVLLIGVHAALLVYCGWCHSPVYNEMGHIGSGLYHLQTGRFEPFRVNPPLVRILAAVPIVWSVPEQEWDYVRESPDVREEYRVGAELFRVLGGQTMFFLRLARWSCLPLALLGAFVCWRWATDLFGNASGVVALILWCFSPNVLGLASLATTDAHAAAISVSAFYIFWRWLRAPRWRRALVAGVALGAAQLAKTLLLVLYPVILVILILNVPQESRKEGQPSRVSVYAMFLVVLVMSVLTINAGYLFRGSFLRLDSYRFSSKAMNNLFGESGVANLPVDAFARTWFGDFRVPLPKDYVLGIDRQKLEFEAGSRCYLAGQWREQGGWW